MPEDEPVTQGNIDRIDTDVLIVGSGISGLADAQIRYPHPHDEFHAVRR